MKTDLGRPLAIGRTAEIYAWKEGQVLKLFHDWFDAADIEHEARISKAIHQSGLPVPAVGEHLRVNGRNGLAYERVAGVSMWEMMQQKPWLALNCARRMATLHVEAHRSPVRVDLPSQRRQLIRKIGGAKALTAELRSAVLAELEALPDGEQLCHGDFHPGNILMSPRGEVIIDWIDATRGNRLADLARSTIVARGAAETPELRNPALRAGIRALVAAYVGRYFALWPGGEAEYRRWFPVVAAARLSEGIRDLEPWLVRQVELGLARARV